MKVAITLLLLFVAGLSEAQHFPGENFKGNEDQLARQMEATIKQVVRQRYPDSHMKRFNQAKSLGCFDATFEVNHDISASLKYGLFAKPARYRAHVRFANASTSDDADRDLRGLSIRVGGVSGNPVWGNPGFQDFVLNSHPVLFAATPEEFLSFIEAQRNESVIWHLLTPTNWDSLFILLTARNNPTSPFDIRYWSTTPYQLGDNQAVKYSVRPCSNFQSELPGELTNNYLRAAMQNHLENTDACFDFMVQRQTNNDDMPIEDASKEWDEADSPFVPVARLLIKQQPFISAEAIKQCEETAFNPWQSLPEHKPLGRMNYVRKQVYHALTRFRKEHNRKLEN
ncbi:catalase [Alteromonas sp. ASW11-130]|uniref:catalase n=1 Tax=Alteromonas sp. ASW11-130 TaxID=3015775 RepID=UPI0022418753|nr:catalase [Alteromonas sp. ASW11-130]MCW8093368.1 catalase [Alteromonas sp. ASW11-130]